jgi:hypothetical protein
MCDGATDKEGATRGFDPRSESRDRLLQKKTASSEKSQSHVELEKFFLRLVTNGRERRSDFQSGPRCRNHDPTSPSGYLQKGEPQQ